jgi:hypothetical protein
MRQMRLQANGWESGVVSHPGTFIGRLIGVRARTAEAVLLDTSSVHTFGLKRPIELVALDSELRVVETRTVAPNHVAWIRSASHILELPAGSPLPDVAQQLEVVDV